MKDGASALILSGSDSYTGGTTVNAGMLIATSATALPAGTSLTVNAGGTFIFDPSVAGATADESTVSSVPEPGTLALFVRRRHRPAGLRLAKAAGNHCGGAIPAMK